LSSDALNFSISMSLKFKDEIEIIISFDGLMEEDSNVFLELTCLTSKYQKGCENFQFFFFFPKEI